MAYGHAERNLALIRQLEAEMRQLGRCSGSEAAPAPAEAGPEQQAHHRADEQATAMAPYRELLRVRTRGGNPVGPSQ